MSAGKVKTLSCPNCDGTVEIHAVGISITAVCKYCGCVIDMSNENLKIIQTAANQQRKITLAIGSRATLFEVEWEVIGYMVRTVKGSGYSYHWEEYLLFNPWQGFRFLVCSDGHWSFAKMLHQLIKTAGISPISYDGQTYKLFSQDTAKVTYVLGEFYWRVKVDERAKVSDFIAPPYVLSKEENEDEVVWTQGVYVEKQVIEQAFKLSSVSKTQGVAPNQPSPFPKHLPKIWGLFCVFFIGLFVTEHFTLDKSNDNKTFFSQAVHTTPEQKDQVILSAPIELKGEKNELEIALSSPVDNNWAELDATLSNDETHETFETSQVLEYYHGSDDEGSWSEGKQQDETSIPAIPAGKYHLSFSPDAGAYAQGQPLDFNVSVKSVVPSFGNFFIAVTSLLLYPLILLYRQSSFEKRRWQDSDYAPLTYRGSDD